jgi:tRNA-Thr(GGU) m(6)t(6)A37 methyltransferase TsaA
VSAMPDVHYELHPIGRVVSSLVNRKNAPRQPDEGAPPAWLEIDPAVADAARDLRAGDEVILLTWLDRARRDTLIVHPRGVPDNAPMGVFSTRSPDRPNPIGLHRVSIVAIDGLRINVSGLEAIDGTPLLDIKPVLGPVEER